MEVRILTLRYSPEQCVIDDAPLTALARDHEVLEVREHFFLVHEVPHLLCVVSCQRRPGVPVTPPTPPTPTSPAQAQPRGSAEPTPTPESAADLTEDQRRLFDTIRRWRVTQAEHDGVPRYVVLTNRNIEALVRDRPADLAALRRIDGIGKAKAERYGEALVGLLHERSPPPPLVASSPTPSPDTAPATTPDPTAPE